MTFIHKCYRCQLIHRLSFSPCWHIKVHDLLKYSILVTLTHIFCTVFCADNRNNSPFKQINWMEMFIDLGITARKEKNTKSYFHRLPNNIHIPLLLFSLLFAEKAALVIDLLNKNKYHCSASIITSSFYKNLTSFFRVLTSGQKQWGRKWLKMNAFLLSIGISMRFLRDSRGKWHVSINDNHKYVGKCRMFSFDKAEKILRKWLIWGNFRKTCLDPIFIHWKHTTVGVRIGSNMFICLFLKAILANNSHSHQ